MSGNVHQDDRTKLKALVYQTSPASLLCEPRQFIAASLKATVTQLAKDRTITDGVETATVTPEGYLDVKTHNPEKCFTQDYANAQVATVIITPTAGKKIRIISVYSSVGANATNVTLSFGTSGNVFFKHYTEKKSTTVGNVICATGATDETVKLTCPINTFISIGYDEVD